MSRPLDSAWHLVAEAVAGYSGFACSADPQTLAPDMPSRREGWAWHGTSATGRPTAPL